MPRKRPSKVYHLHVSIPIEIYRAMKKDIASLNWSAIATEAFVEALRLRGEGRIPKYMTIEERLTRLEEKVTKLEENRDVR